MTATLINGKQIADQLLTTARQRVAHANVTPGLAVIMVGDNPASQVYIRNKIRACDKTGILSYRYDLPADTAESEVLAKIQMLNDDPKIHGILLQLPMPAHINADKVLETIVPEKDVDGFHALQMGRLVADLPSLRPCTPAGCMVLLENSGIALAGAHAVIIGRSHIVGKPMALMLINAGATVTVCNSRTRDLSRLCRAADILIVAVGRAQMVGTDMVKPGAIVIDVGINRLPEGGIVGDVYFDTVKEVAGAITPVPGGVGPMTIAQLVHNTLQAAGI